MSWFTKKSLVSLAQPMPLHELKKRTKIVVTDDAQGAVEELLGTDESSALTPAGSPAEGDTTFFDIFRDVSDANDDMVGDARLIGVSVFYTVYDASDA